ncbi:hypothetical protein AAC387_Pa06g0438 [Persea americana]
MRNCTPYVFMVFVQLAYGWSSILIKLALEKGLSYLVLIVYRHLFAIILLGPLAYAFERMQWSNLSFTVVLKIFFLSSLGTTVHLNLYYMGLDYTSPTVGGALSNVIPGLTFILTVLLGMEKVQIRRVGGKAKLLGAVICIGGALIFTLWKGYQFKGLVGRPLISINRKDDKVGPGHDSGDWMKGSALILASHVAWSAWLVLQAKVYEVYPARLTINTMICFFASLQCSLLALVFERNSSSWRLEWNIQLLAIIYCGIVNSALLYYLQTWCISVKGPVFVAMFSPLLLVVVAVFSACVFAERLHLGSLIGAFLIIVGLYCVLWGKSKDGHDAKSQGKPREECTSLDKKHQILTANPTAKCDLNQDV